MLTRMCAAAARAQLPQRMHSARAALPTVSRLQPAQAALSVALQLQCRTLSSAPRPSSATMTAAQRVEHELSLSNARRSERARRLEELRELEAQLHEHRLQESVSLSWHARLHWSKHGPIIAAILCAAASMSAAYHLWQTNHVFTQEKNKLSTQIGSIAQQIDTAHRRRTNEQEDSQRIIKGYMQSKTALVTAPASIQPAAPAATAGGWFSKKPAATAAVVPTPAVDAAGAAGVEPLVTRTYGASKADLAQLSQLQNGLQQAYSA